MLVATWLFLGSRAKGEATPPRQPLSSFPLELPSGWRGYDLEMDPVVLDRLRLSDYSSRIYVPAESAASRTPVSLYIGYYQSQRTGATYHSPKNCLPGGGWHIADVRVAQVSLPERGSIQVNRIVIEKGLERQLVVYWYYDRGRVIASEYEAKIALVWDAMTRNRTDGALVRIITPVQGDVEEAWGRTVFFLREIWPYLARHMPA
jgi:EpsI family protein